MDWAVHLGAAAALVVRENPPAGEGNERVLHRNLRTSLARVAPLHVETGEGRLQDHGRGWTRPPGGIDILATADSESGLLALGAEVKIRKLDELLWDAIKIGQRRAAEAWPHALTEAAIIVELAPDDTEHPLAPKWFDAATREVEVYDAIRSWTKAWYGLMCGGRGIRPTSLPKTVRLGAGGTHHYADGTLLCWRAIDADRVDDAERRVPVDGHGIPVGLEIPAEWRHQIELAGARRQGDGREPLRSRATLPEPPTRTIVAIATADSVRLWVDVWARGFTVPTSFRIVDQGALAYDLRIANDGAQHRPPTPKPLPEWCRSAVEDEFRRWSRAHP